MGGVANRFLLTLHFAHEVLSAANQRKSRSTILMLLRTPAGKARGVMWYIACKVGTDLIKVLRPIVVMFLPCQAGSFVTILPSSDWKYTLLSWHGERGRPCHRLHHNPLQSYYLNSLTHTIWTVLLMNFQEQLFVYCITFTLVVLNICRDSKCMPTFWRNVD